MTIFEHAMINDISFFKTAEYDINIKDEYGKNLLHYAVLGNAFDVIYELIKLGINIDERDNEGETAIFDCARKAKIEIAKILIISHANLNIVNNLGENLMHLAAAKGNKTFIKLLHENKVLANVETFDYKYPVHYAVLSGNIDSIKYVLSIANQSFLLKDNKNNTLLHYAANTSNDLMIYYLISEGINPNMLNDNYETAVFNAVRFGTKETVNALLSNDSFIKIRNKNNETPHDYALIYEKYQIETLLTNYAMLPKYERLERNQALTIATLNRDIATIKALLNNSVTMRYDRYNFSALDYAKMYNFTEIASILKKYPII